MVVLTALALRTYHLGTRSLWFDEALDANISRGPLTETEEGFRSSLLPHTPGESSLHRLLEDTRGLNSAPVAHPYLLFLIQRVSHGATAVRIPSVLASVLAVVIVLITEVGGGRTAGLLAAALLALSSTQIRYAQEVREYSLSVLFAAMMLYYFLDAHRAGIDKRYRIGMYLVFLLSPVVQYGLALFAVGIVGAMLISWLVERPQIFQLSDLLLTSSAIASGGIASYFLTLRDQFGPRPPYLAPNYFNPQTMGLTTFIVTDTKQLIQFVIPGKMLTVIVAIAVLWLGYQWIRSRSYDAVIVATLTTVTVVVAAALAGVYPYGGIRQCIFLAPVICLLAGHALESLTRMMSRYRNVATIVLLAIIVAAGCRELSVHSPYSEIEDVTSLLSTLKATATEGDHVYVYWGAVPAISFYSPTSTVQFVYGTYHPKDPREYSGEVRKAAAGSGGRLWLLFTHFDPANRELIVKALVPEWRVRLAGSGNGAELYLGERKSAL
jgi:hypothetical protein